MVKSILDEPLRAEIIDRVRKLNKNLQAQWGSMNVFQMVKHCRFFEAWIHGIGDWDYSASRSTPTQAAEALIAVTSDDTPIMKPAPSTQILIVNETEVDFEKEKDLWISHLEAYQNYHNPAFVHDFFGKMKPEQIGILAYKHTDHHLRQFGV
jgi:hypothetical protein